jgi:hypothetical protein
VGLSVVAQAGLLLTEYTRSALLARIMGQLMRLMGAGSTGMEFTCTKWLGTGLGITGVGLTETCRIGVVGL